jgi:hypothetical protein
MKGPEASGLSLSDIIEKEREYVVEGSGGAK